MYDKNSGRKVTAVAVLQGEQLAKQSNQNLWLRNLALKRRTAIKQYLGDAPTFNLVFFNKVFDCRSLNINLGTLAARVHGLKEPATLQGAKYMNREDKAWNSLAWDSLMVFLRDSQCPVRPAVSLRLC